jgi:hypothetical protein
MQVKVRCRITLGISKNRTEEEIWFSRSSSGTKTVRGYSAAPTITREKIYKNK